MLSNFTKKFTAISVCVLVTAIFYSPDVVHAKDRHAIAVLNMGRIMTEADAVKSINQQTAKLQDIHREKIRKTEADLRKEQTELRQRKGFLPKAQFDKKASAFIKKTKETRRKFEQQAKSLRAAKSSALNKVRNAITPIVTEIVNKRKISLVIAQLEVIFAKKELNITDTVIEQLNSRLKTVNVDAGSLIVK